MFEGDTHTRSDYRGEYMEDLQYHGLYSITTSKDGRFKAQMYQCPNMQMAVGWINALAFDIDGTRIVIRPPQYGVFVNHGPIYIRANDVEYMSDQLPFTIPGTNIDIRAHKPPWKFNIVTEGFDAWVEMIQHSEQKWSFINTGIRLDPANVPDVGSEDSVCMKGADASPIADDTSEADWSATLFSTEDHNHICAYCTAHNKKSWLKEVRDLKCVKPPPVPPAPPAKEQCDNTGCSWTHAQQLCQSLQGNDVLYNDCLFDFCLECIDEAAEAFVENEEDDHPGAMCVQGAPECAPDEVCTEAVKMNTLTVSHNNLGGVGPDDGAEEIRYGNAAVVNGRAVDLVLTTDSTFKSARPSKNGNAGPFGLLNVKCGSAVSVTMKVVDTETGSPVTLDSVALTWYDLDEGKRGRGRATVQTCGSTGAIVSENTELTVKREGGCSSATSSVAGTSNDNPQSPHNLNSVQISRSVTLPFKGVSEFTSTLSLAKGSKGRNFLFAIEPSVACGL